VTIPSKLNADGWVPEQIVWFESIDSGVEVLSGIRVKGKENEHPGAPIVYSTFINCPFEFPNGFTYVTVLDVVGLFETENVLPVTVATFVHVELFGETDQVKFLAVPVVIFNESELFPLLRSAPQ
jgi:hypothetical protein